MRDGSPLTGFRKQFDKPFFGSPEKRRMFGLSEFFQQKRRRDAFRRSAVPVIGAGNLSAGAAELQPGILRR